jgi:2-phosphoglycolate phosphatase
VAFGGERLRARGVVFDLDGTLIDGYQGIATALNAARFAFGMPPLPLAEVRGRVGHGLPHLMADVVGVARAPLGIAIFRAVYDRICEEQTHLLPDVAVTLAELRERGLRMSVASNKPASYSIRILERLGLRSFFDAVEGPDTAGSAKPDPAMIRACVAAMGVAVDETVYVGDMTLDADSGAHAGVAVVLVAGGSSPDDALRETGFPVVSSMKELPARLPS